MASSKSAELAAATVERQEYLEGLDALGLKPAKTPGDKSQCGIYALADAIAGGKFRDCGFERKQEAGKIFAKLKAFIDDKKKYKSFATEYLITVHGKEKMTAKEILVKHISASADQTCFYTATDLLILLGYYQANFDTESNFKLLILSGELQPGSDAKIEYISHQVSKDYKASADKVPLAIRNIDNVHWEGFVPTSDPQDISVTGALLPVDDFMRIVDPRFNGGVFPTAHKHGKDTACASEILRNAFDAGGKACLNKSLAEINKDKETQRNKSPSKKVKTKSGQLKPKYKKPKHDASSTKGDESGSETDSNSDTDDGSDSDSDTESESDDADKPDLPSDPREISGEVGGMAESRSGADKSAAKESVSKIIRTHDDLELRTFSGAPRLPTFAQMKKQLTDTDGKKAPDPKLVELQPRIRKSDEMNSIRQDYTHYSYLVQNVKGMDVYTPYRKDITDVTNLSDGEPEVRTSLTKSGIAAGIRLTWTFKRNYTYQDKNRCSKHEGYVEWSFGKVYNHKKGMDANGIKPGSFSAEIDDADPTRPLLHIRFVPQVSIGCNITATQDFLDRGKLSGKEKAVEETALRWTAGDIKQIHLVLLPQSSEVGTREAQLEKGLPGSDDWHIKKMQQKLLQLAKDPAVTGRRGFAPYMHRSGRPQVQANQMLSRAHVIKQGAPLLKMTEVTRFNDTCHAETALGHGTHLDFVEERLRCDTLSRQECAAYLIKVGENVVVHIELPDTLRFSADDTETYKPPPNSRVELSVVSKKHGKSIEVNGLIIEEELETRIPNAKSDLVVLVTEKNAAPLFGMAKSFAKISNLQRLGKSVDRYATRVKIEPNDLVYRHKMDSVHKTYDPKETDGSRAAWNGMLFFDGTRDKTTLPPTNPYHASNDDKAVGDKAYRDLQKKTDWDDSQKSSVHRSKRLQTKCDVTIGAGGSGKTKLITETSTAAVASGGLVVLTSERKSVVQNLVLNYDRDRAPGSKPPVLVLAGTGSRSSIAEQMTTKGSGDSSDLPSSSPAQTEVTSEQSGSEKPVSPEQDGTPSEAQDTQPEVLAESASPDFKADTAGDSWAADESAEQEKKPAKQKIDWEQIDDAQVAAEISAVQDHQISIISHALADKKVLRVGAEALTVSGHIIRHLEEGTEHFYERTLDVAETFTHESSDPANDEFAKQELVTSEKQKFDLFARLRGYLEKLQVHDFRAKNEKDEYIWSDMEKRNFRTLHEDAEKYVVATADVIGSTASNCGNELVRKSFASEWACSTAEERRAQLKRKVFIKMDEAQTVSEPTALILIGKTYSEGSWGSRIVAFSMFADEKQIGIINLSHDYTIGHEGKDRGVCYNEWLAQINVPLVVRLIRSGHPVSRLEFQSRMPEVLFAPVNDEFYDGRIQTREPRGGFPHPENMEEWHNYMHSFSDQPGNGYQTEYAQHALHLRIGRRHLKERHCVRTPTGGRVNLHSLMTTWAEVRKLRRVFGATMNANVGIQTTYHEQMNQHKRMANEMRREGWSDDEIPELFVTDSAVGREKLIVIGDYVSDIVQGLGFMKSKNRMCVFFTRARFAMITIGANIIPLEKEKKEFEDDDPETVAFSHRDLGDQLKDLGRIRGVQKTPDDDEKPVSGLALDGKFSILKMLNYMGQNFATEDIACVAFNLLGVPRRLWTYQQRLALKAYVAYQNDYRGNRSATEHNLSSAEREEFPAYLNAFQDMLEDQYAASKTEEINDFVPIVKGFETGQEKPLGEWGAMNITKHIKWKAVEREANAVKESGGVMSVPSTPVMHAHKEFEYFGQRDYASSPTSKVAALDLAFTVDPLNTFGQNYEQLSGLEHFAASEKATEYFADCPDLLQLDKDGYPLPLTSGAGVSEQVTASLGAWGTVPDDNSSADTGFAADNGAGAGGFSADNGAGGSSSVW
jgi:hypothetical protein